LGRSFCWRSTWCHLRRLPGPTLPAVSASVRTAEREVGGAKKRVLSAVGRGAIAKAAKKRWVKVRKQAKKVAG
jgi:hypothetical protein